MAVIKRYNELLNLDEIDVLIDEVDKSRHIIVSDFPESMPQGRSSFAIEVSPFMKSGVELQMDFIDSEGASIYSEPVADYLEGTARRVSVEVYSDTAPGIATLIIVGELEAVPEDNTIFSDSDPVPDEYAGHYNIRLTKQVLINPTSPNTQPIKFFTQPKITVSEISIGTMQRSEVTSSISSSRFDIEGFPTDADLVFKPYGNLDEEIGGSVLQEATDDTVPAPSRQRNVKAYTETKKVKFRKGLRKNSVGKRSGFVAKANSPAKFPYLLKPGTFNGNEAFRFSTKHIGGTVKFFDHNLGNLFEDSDYYPADALADAGLNSETPTYDTSKVPGRTDFAKTPYTASIVDLINDQTAVVDAPFTNKNLNNENIVLPIYAKGEITFESLPTASYAAANLVSYADVRLSNMRTFSGDVFKVKVYVKSEGGFDDYKLLAEVPLEGKELLLDSGSVGQGERSGYVIKQSDISTYWDVYGGIDGLQEMSAADSDASASYDNSTLLDSIELSGSISQNNHNVRLQLKDNYEFDLDPKLDYTLSANIVGRKEYGKGALAIYVSGSSMKQKKFLYNDPTTSEDIQESSAYGKRLGVLELKAEDDIKKDFGLLTHNFTPDLSGSGVLQFRAISGKWNISDISIQPSDDTGFSPAFFQFKQELPASLSHKRPDKFEFLVEFYDVNNNISDTTVYASSIDFQGTNMTITGNDNVLESSLFIGGDTIGGGMHLGGVTSTLPETGGSGADGSGFMRSVGYQGFTSASAQSGSYGFMIWSGSVLPDSGDTYSGVGLELVGVSGSFKFRTNPSVFDVRADSFFVGRQDIQFVSGAAGNVEISSSEFHLTPQGNVTASAILLGNKAGNNYLQFVDDTLTVAGDLTVNNLFLPATINGAPSTRLNASSSLDALGHAKFVSASIGGWNVTPDYIFKPISGAAAHKDITRVYLSATQDNIKNIAEGLQVYRKDEDVEDGGVKVVRIGGLSDTTNLHANDEYGIQVIKQNSAGSYSNLMYIGPSTQEIAGWTIDSDKLTGGDMIIEKSGTIRSSNYVKDQAGSGFILTAAEGGYLEVENAKIRGTMATTTFEKESVNAVGGQLYVANSTTLTASAFPTTAYPGGHGNGVYQANETTMSVVNVSGFSVGEVLTLKKVHSTGFSTEYVRVNSSSVANPGSDTDLSGQLYVTRGYSGSRPTGQDSSSLGDVASSPTFYSGSQVIVSTGKIGTGFIRINANPNDSATPYIDIVERTGSAIYDTELKARLGDLSGVAGTRNVPNNFTGFGLMSEVAFLSGSNIKLEAPTFLLGDLNKNFVSGSNGNIQISSSQFHVDSKNNIFHMGNLSGSKISFDGTSLEMSSSRFFLGSDSTAFVSGSNGNIEISSSKFHLDADGDIIADDATFKGQATAEIFKFTKLAINSGNEDDYFSNYTGADYRGGTTNYTKLDLSGATHKARTYVTISRRARYPIAHIVPPSTSGVSILYLQFTDQTTGLYQQNLICSWGGGADVISGMNSSTYRATDGGDKPGGIFFESERFDSFRGYFYHRDCLVGSDHGGMNTSPAVHYHMSHHVMEDVIYTLMLKNGKWFIMDVSATKTGPNQNVARTFEGRTGALAHFNKVQAQTIFRAGRYGIAHLGDYAVTASTETSTVAFNLNLGGSLADDGENSTDEATEYGGYFLVDQGSWDTTKDVTGVQHALSGKGLWKGRFTDRSALSSDNTFTIFDYENVDDSDTIHMQIRQAHGSATTTIEIGDNGDEDRIILKPQNGDIEITGGITTSAGNSVFNESGNDHNFRIESVNVTSMFKVDAGDDFVAIGASTQGDGLARLTTHTNDANFIAEFINSTNDGNADGVMVNYTGHADLDSGAKFYQARDSANDIMFEVQGDSSGGHNIDSSFTAGHDTACLDENELMPGLIIESTGEIWHKPSSSFSTALPFTRLSNSNGSKSVFGVIRGIPLQYDATGSMVNADKGEQYVKNGYYMPPAFTRYAKNSPTGSANRQLNTMSIGEGVMWLTNINGDIENGDYVESSVIKGYGRKQNDDILRSKTVAKVTETINWSEVTSSIQYSGSAYKKHLTAVTFHCG